MGNSIISISVNDKMLGEIEELQRGLGFSGRSELIRAGLKMLISDKKEKDAISGSINSVLVVVHEEKNELEINKYKHLFNEIIKTHVHTNLKNNCMDVFILEGDAKRIKGLAESMQKIKNIDYIKLIVS